MKPGTNHMGIQRASRRAVLGSQFNPAMLSTAREANRLSQADVAQALGVSQALIGKWEASLGIPNKEQIVALATTLGVLPDFFYVDRAKRLASLSDFYHRALSKARRQDVKAIHARCSIIDIQIDRLLNITELPADRIPNIDPAEFSGDVERIADVAREEMEIRPGPIRSLVDEIEKCGAIVIDRSLEVCEVDALCRWVPELPKLFFLNGAKPADRIRFSLAHELAHTVLHFGRDCNPKQAEEEADTFASAFLMPAKDIRRDFRGRVSLTALAAIKRKWRVSMQAAARRAHTLGVINADRYRSLCIQMSRKGWRKSEPVNISGEAPRVFSQLLQMHLDSGYSRLELAQLLFVPEQAIDDMLADMNAPNILDNGVRLRIVRDDD